MTKLDWGDLYWGLWLFGLFLIPELLAVFGIAPWPTLSDTAWGNEKLYPILKTALFGFLIGLAIHIRFGTKFFRAEAGGIFISLIVHAMWGLV